MPKRNKKAGKKKEDNAKKEVEEVVDDDMSYVDEAQLLAEREAYARQQAEAQATAAVAKEEVAAKRAALVDKRTNEEVFELISTPERVASRFTRGSLFSAQALAMRIRA